MDTRQGRVGGWAWCIVMSMRLPTPAARIPARGARLCDAKEMAQRWKSRPASDKSQGNDNRACIGLGTIQRTPPSPEEAEVKINGGLECNDPGTQ